MRVATSGKNPVPKCILLIFVLEIAFFRLKGVQSTTPSPTQNVTFVLCEPGLTHANELGHTSWVNALSHYSQITRPPGYIGNVIYRSRRMEWRARLPWQQSCKGFATPPLTNCIAILLTIFSPWLRKHSGVIPTSGKMSSGWSCNPAYFSTPQDRFRQIINPVQVALQCA